MDNTSSLLPVGLDQLRSRERETSSPRGELGQQAFLDLMVTQLKNQDPFKPMESGDFLGQIAQFSTVNGINGLQQSFASLASSLQSSQALQASTMVGREVVIPQDKVGLRAGATAVLATDVPAAAGNVQVKITDSAGQLVRQLALGAQGAGPLRIEWDGLRGDGTPAAPGTYGVRIEANIGGRLEALASAVQARVNSVSVSRDGAAPMLNIDGVGAVAMTDVIEIL